MRTAPAFQLCPQRSRGWSVGVGALFALAGGSALWWAGQSEGPARLLGLAAALWTLGWAVWHRRRHRGSVVASLRWDGQCWHWGAAHAVGPEPVPGRIRVCLDFSGFMLLQLRPFDRTRSAPVWLPLDRRGQAAQWHSLRCALHAPQQPAPSPGAGA